MSPSPEQTILSSDELPFTESDLPATLFREHHAHALLSRERHIVAAWSARDGVRIAVLPQSNMIMIIMKLLQVSPACALS